MTHNYVLVETLDTGALRLRCPVCGRQIRVTTSGKVTEAEGDRWATHRYAAQSDGLRLVFDKTEER